MHAIVIRVETTFGASSCPFSSVRRLGVLRDENQRPTTETYHELLPRNLHSLIATVGDLRDFFRRYDDRRLVRLRVGRRRAGAFRRQLDLLQLAARRAQPVLIIVRIFIILRIGLFRLFAPLFRRGAAAEAMQADRRGFLQQKDRNDRTGGSNLVRK